MEKKSLLDAKQYSEDKFTKNVLAQKTGHIAFTLQFLPGQSLPVHTHPNSILFITVLEGWGTVTINDEERAVSTHDFLVVDGDERFGFVNTGNDPTQLYVVLCKTSESNVKG